LPRVQLLLLRDDAPLGVIGLSARQAGGFSDTQVALLETFAEQAVIAISSAETYRALRERSAALTRRNSEYSEQVAYQAATIDVLRALSASRDDTRPVFDTIRLVRGVRAVRPRSETEGVSSFEVEVEPGQDIRPELARAVVQKGLDLLSLRELGMSLEEIFLHLTTTDAAEEPQAHALQGEVTA